MTAVLYIDGATVTAVLFIDGATVTAVLYIDGATVTAVLYIDGATVNAIIYKESHILILLHWPHSFIYEELTVYYNLSMRKNRNINCFV